MRSDAIPFRFEIRTVLRGLARAADARPSAVLLSLPFINVLVHPSAIERDIATEIIVRVSDRRVLRARECCDDCIEKALRSLQELRAELVTKRVHLIAERDGPLYQLIELMLVAIRQFLTFEQQLSNKHRPSASKADQYFRLPEDRQTYFDALELLRGHLSRCLGQITVIAGMGLPSDGLIVDYQGDWPLNAYKSIDDLQLDI